MEVARYDSTELKRFCEEVLVSLGMTQEDAEVAADSLVRADLEGLYSHGLGRLVIYARRIKEGRISARPDVLVERTGSVLRVDGGNGLGQVASYHALLAAMPVARETGISSVAVRNSNHFGTAAYYCQMACREGIVLIAMTNSPPGIAPWGGKRAYFGTNPIAFGFPTRQKPPVIVDMSSSVVARGRIIFAAKQGLPIPEGWAIDEEGVGTTDPEDALKGAVLPLGGAKGYALALAVEIMSGVLSGAAFGPHVNNLYKEGKPPANVGHSFILLDVSSWIPADEYYERMEQFLWEIKTSPRAKGVEEILYPGERRYRTYLENQEKGIPLPEAVREELESLGREHRVTFPVTAEA
ncbi:MAG: Ldh family oxidoreductase [Actinomycetota bacterium]|nr:Ldh family oxidoreductase [Actinomycetota bacterium]